MDLIEKLLFGRKYAICAFCGAKIKKDDAVFSKDYVGICKNCNKEIRVAPFEFLYEGTENVRFIIAPLYFAGNIRTAIHNMKFNSMPGVAFALGYYLVNYLSVFEEREDRLFDEFDILVPVPLSEQRMNERGYNQAELIANEISRAFKIPVKSSVLIKHKHTKAQSTLEKSERKENLENAYIVKGDILGKRILLIDDVCTTGNTLESCAKVLMESGAKSVAAITLTHGTVPKHSFSYHEMFS